MTFSQSGFARQPKPSHSAQNGWLSNTCMGRSTSDLWRIIRSKIPDAENRINPRPELPVINTPHKSRLTGFAKQGILSCPAADLVQWRMTESPQFLAASKSWNCHQLAKSSSSRAAMKHQKNCQETSFKTSMSSIQMYTVQSARDLTFNLRIAANLPTLIKRSFNVHCTQAIFYSFPRSTLVHMAWNPQ